MPTNNLLILSLLITTQSLAVTSRNNHLSKDEIIQQSVDYEMMMVDKESGMNMLQNAFLGKRMTNEAPLPIEDQLLQLSDEPPQTKYVADEALSLKDIYKTKIVVFGVIWTVFDWTIFIIIVAILIVATLFFCLFCCCLENSRE